MKYKELYKNLLNDIFTDIDDKYLELIDMDNQYIEETIFGTIVMIVRKGCIKEYEQHDTTYANRDCYFSRYEMHKALSLEIKRVLNMADEHHENKKYSEEKLERKILKNYLIIQDYLYSELG